MGKDMIMNQNERLDYLAEQFKQPDGYRETIECGIAGVRRFRGGLTEGNLPREKAIQKLKTEIAKADAVVIGAGAGLSTSAGFI